LGAISRVFIQRLTQILTARIARVDIFPKRVFLKITTRRLLVFMSRAKFSVLLPLATIWANATTGTVNQGKAYARVIPPVESM
jgi:hypothetical protein